MNFTELITPELIWLFDVTSSEFVSPFSLMQIGCTQLPWQHSICMAFDKVEITKVSKIKILSVHIIYVNIYAGLNTYIYIGKLREAHAPPLEIQRQQYFGATFVAVENCAV